MNKKIPKIKDRYAFIIGMLLSLLVCLGIFFYYGQKKEIMFCDEVYTYTVANVHGVHIAVRDNKWYVEEEMDKRFSSLEGYNFRDVRMGTGNDMSPPIYYNSFKAVAATFPTSTSKWLGFGTNLISFIPLLIILYWGIWKITKNSLIASAFTVLLGVNPGMQGIALLIRMYMLFTFWLLIFFKQTEVMYSKNRKLLFYAGVGINTFFGFMTQYYYAIYVALFSAFFLLDKMLKKDWKQIFAYLGAMVAAVAAATLYFPQWIKHIFETDKGSSSFTAVTDWSNIGQEVLEAFEQIGKFVIPNSSILYWILLIVISSSFFLIKSEEIAHVKKNYAIHLTVQTLYYCIIAHVMPTLETRYFWAVIMLQCMMMLHMLAYVIKYRNALGSKKAAAILVGIAIIYAALFPQRMKFIPYHGAEYKEGRLIMEEYSQTPWIIYGEKDWILHCTAFDFLIPEQLKFHTDTSTMEYDEMLADRKEFVLYVRSEEHLNVVLGKIAELYGREWQAEKLAARSYNDAYLITLE